MDNVCYEVLFKIKKIDDEVKCLESKKKKNPSFILDLRDVLKQKKSELIEKETLLKLEQDKLGTVESVVLDNSDKLKKAESKLAQVTNAKEYHLVNKEINALKKTIANLDTQKEKQISTIGAINEQIALVESNLSKVSMDYESASVSFKDEANLIDRDLKDLLTDKKDLLTGLPENVVCNYNKIFERKRNAVISMINASRCTGCNMVLPPQFCNEIIKGEEVKLCPSCQRLIIYLEDKKQ